MQRARLSGSSQNFLAHCEIFFPYALALRDPVVVAIDQECKLDLLSSSLKPFCYAIEAVLWAALLHDVESLKIVHRKRSRSNESAKVYQDEYRCIKGNFFEKMILSQSWFDETQKKFVF